MSIISRPKIKIISNHRLTSLLIFILLFSLFNQWVRWLPVYLSAVSDTSCDGKCSSVPFTPLCKSCVNISLSVNFNDNKYDTINKNHNSQSIYIDSLKDITEKSNFKSYHDESIEFNQLLMIPNNIYSIHSQDITIPLEITPNLQESKDSYAVIHNKQKLSAYQMCEECHQCRKSTNSEYYNMMDGICMTTKEYGMMTGLGFSLSFGIFGLFAGFLVDMKSDRGSTILGMSCLFCGLTTLLASYSQKFYNVLILRFLLGSVQAFGAPSSVYLITSYFNDSSERVGANAAYTMGVYLGAGLSSLSTILSSYYGWRFVLQIVGYAIIITAVLYEIFVDINILHAHKSSPSKNSNSRHHHHYHHHRIQKSVVTNLINDTEYSSYQQNESRPLLYDPSEESSIEYDSNEYDETLVNENPDTEDYSDISPKERLIHSSTPSVVSDPVVSYSTNNTYGTVLSTVQAISVPMNDNNNHSNNFSSNNSGDNSKISKIESSMDHRYDIDNHKTIYDLLSLIITKGEIPIVMPLVLLASGLRFMSGIVIFVYFPVITARKFPKEVNLFSIFNAVILLSCGSASSYIGGKLGQISVKDNGTKGLIRLVIYSSLFSVGPFLVAILARKFWIALLCLTFGYLFGEAWMSLSLAVLQTLSPKKAQGLTMASYLFLNWIASAIAVDIIGWIDPGTAKLENILAITVMITILSSSICFYLLERLFTQYETKVKHLRENKIAAMEAMQEDIK